MYQELQNKDSEVRAILRPFFRHSNPQIDLYNDGKDYIRRFWDVTETGLWVSSCIKLTLSFWMTKLLHAGISETIHPGHLHTAIMKPLRPPR